jgi:anti-anti-sigma factor
LEVIVAETFFADYARDNGTVVVRFIGELDIAGANRAEEVGTAALSELDGETTPLVIDVSELTFCDSSGLQAMMRIRASAEVLGRQVTLRKPSAMLRRTLELTDLRGLFVFDE